MMRLPNEKLETVIGLNSKIFGILNSLYFINTSNNNGETNIPSLSNIEIGKYSLSAVAIKKPN